MDDSSHPTPFDVWSKASSRVFSSFLQANQAANRAALSVFTSSPTHNGDREAVETGVDAEDRIEPGADLDEWVTARNIEGELSVGDTIEFTKTISERDLKRFAAASGDTNPIHLDEEWAENTRFNGRIAHGILVAGLISAALARIPGSVIYLSQDLEFRAPVRIGDRVTATVEIAEDLGSNQYRIRTVVMKGDDPVIDGEAVVLVDATPHDA